MCPISHEYIVWVTTSFQCVPLKVNDTCAWGWMTCCHNYLLKKKEVIYFVGYTPMLPNWVPTEKWQDFKDHDGRKVNHFEFISYRFKKRIIILITCSNYNF
jgi:hypothetical protein